MRFARLGVLTLFLVQVVPAHTADPKDVPKNVEKRLGDNLIDLLQNASRVEVFRISPEQSAKPGEGISGYPILATGKEKAKDFAGKLATVLLSENTYFGEQSRCFIPGVALRIWRPKEQDRDSVDVIICFKCSALHLVYRDERKRDVKHIDGAFGPDNRALLKLVKEAFPDDAEIQAIKETK
jgi:hypothetical protein